MSKDNNSTHEVKEQVENNALHNTWPMLGTLLSGIIIVIGGYWFISWLYDADNFPIQKVELVNRLENQQSDELLNTAGKNINGGFFNLNVDDFRTAIVSLPWIKQVSVRKVWPDKLLLTITEQKPQTRWLTVTRKGLKDREKYNLLSADGKIFKPDLNQKQRQLLNKLPLLYGPESSAPEVLKQCLAMTGILKQMTVETIQCGMDARRAWQLDLSNGIRVHLGKKEIATRLQRFVIVFSKQLVKYIDYVNYADLRYTNGFSIKWIAAVKTETGEAEIN